MNRARQHTDGENHSGDTTVIIKRPHRLWKTGDAGAPDVIKDQNGDVVLGQCRDCGRAEIELSEPCTGPRNVVRTVLCEACETNQRQPHHRLCESCNQRQADIQPVTRAEAIAQCSVIYHVADTIGRRRTLVDRFHAALMAQLHVRCQPDRGDVFAFMDDQKEAMEAALAVVFPPVLVIDSGGIDLPALKPGDTFTPEPGRAYTTRLGVPSEQIRSTLTAVRKRLVQLSALLDCEARDSQMAFMGLPELHAVDALLKLVQP